MKKMNMIVRKCKSLSRQLGRSSSYSSLRSKSTRDDLTTIHYHHKLELELEDEDEDHPAVQLQQHRAQPDGQEIILVGSTRKPYVINSEYLNHPILKSLMEKQQQQLDDNNDVVKVVKCEVVLFDHLLWMLDNADPNFISDSSLEELANLYVF